MSGLFVTGTDTEVGKTVVAAAIVAALVAQGVTTAAFKPVVTGLDEPAGLWPRDHELLGALTATDPALVSPLRYGPAVSPHLAAQLSATPIDPATLVALARAAGARAQAIVVEGVGGLLVPLADGYAIRDFARELGLGVVIAARPGLGTINHTLLTLEAARAVGLTVRAVVLTPWPAAPSAIEQSNRETIADRGAVEVCTLAQIAGPDPVALAAAGATLDPARWLQPGAALDRPAPSASGTTFVA